MFWIYFSIIICVIVGILLWVAEIFLLPGLTVAAIFGTVFMGASVWLSFTHLGIVAAALVFVINLLSLAVAVYFFMRSRALDKMSLDTVLPGKAAENKQQEFSVGEEGVTVSRLAPYGKAEFGGKAVEVKVNQGFVENNTPVRIRTINDNIIVVEPIN
ncbi:MAG: NfeD family protein [Bacteroidales bacterium]|nr:NfeD family protein [Bacteroidales bacterium]